ncbi:hypothetical protein [Chryseolinea lacunae]|uniref:Uncharacterized protein n=1 Tax=Chryseolinea lacunae TaxID=2801331 RepID=A0ABS1KP12_9BACT|nr:hypothetical protein [Chryseolinea lacunae]MBL0741068.1 hypothetical protein [Chryseolinea lacunae]
MAMTDKERVQLRAYSISLLSQYGFRFSENDPVLPALYIIHKEMQSNIETNQKIVSQIDQASSRISPKVFHFNCEGESWKFQLAIAVKWMIWTGLGMASVSLGIWYWSLRADINEARKIINAHDRISQLATRAKKDNLGNLVIDFTEAKGDSAKRFWEYRRVDKRTIRLFIGGE